jgi:hypothetical protein
MSIPITNPTGYRKCVDCELNDGEFESMDCCECWNHPYMKDNFIPKSKKRTESD